MAFDDGDINNKMVCRRHIIACLFFPLSSCYDKVIIV